MFVCLCIYIYIHIHIHTYIYASFGLSDGSSYTVKFANTIPRPSDKNSDNDIAQMFLV